MATISLPRVPESGHELEDYVAGMFQAAGYFVEKNIRQRDVTDILELDAVATSYDGPVPIAVLAEAKGGKWGFPDIFKVAGWMAYLGIGLGGFFVKEPPGTSTRDMEHIQRTIAPLGVSVVNLGDFSDAAARLGARGFRPFRDQALVDVWRLSYWVERTLVEGLRAERRAHPDRRGAQEVIAYHDLINDHVFFLKNVAERLRRLYDGYRSHPKLAAALASEMVGGPYDARSRPPLTEPASRVLTEAMYEGKHTALQACFYVEHRARLSILKAMIDLACLADTGAPVPTATREIWSGLPATFREGLSALRAKPNYRRYALLWQVFLGGFGGFYLADREHEEFARLSEQTGVPIEEIGDGLRAFDTLFPLSRGPWIVPVRGTPIRVAKMVPAALRGVGAVQRLRWRRDKNYDRMGLGALGRRNLITWHNALVQALAQAKKPSR